MGQFCGCGCWKLLREGRRYWEQEANRKQEVPSSPSTLAAPLPPYCPLAESHREPPTKQTRGLQSLSPSIKRPRLRGWVWNWETIALLLAHPLNKLTGSCLLPLEILPGLTMFLEGKASAHSDPQGPTWTGSQISDLTSSSTSLHSAPAAVPWPPCSSSDMLGMLLSDSLAQAVPSTPLECSSPRYLASSPTFLQPLITCYLFKKTCPDKPIEYSILPPHLPTPALPILWPCSVFSFFNSTHHFYHTV